MVSFRFSQPSTSHLTYQLLFMIDSRRLKMDQADEAPSLIAEEAWKPLRRAEVYSASTGDDGEVCRSG
jgi:hypothetical protein